MFQWLTTMRALSLNSIVPKRTFSYLPLYVYEAGSQSNTQYRTLPLHIIYVLPSMRILPLGPASLFIKAHKIEPGGSKRCFRNLPCKNKLGLAGETQEKAG